MTSPDRDRRVRLATLVAQRRVDLGWPRDRAARESTVTITTYMRVETGQSVRDVTYGKIERALGWAAGSCLAILEGAEAAQLAGEEVDGIWAAPVPVPASAEGALRDALQNAVVMVMPDTPAGKMSQFTDEVIREMRRRGLLPGGSSDA